MLINVSTRRFGRAVRLPEGDVPAPPGSGVFEVGGLAEVCGDVGGAAGRLHGCRSVRAPPCVEIDALHLGDDLVLVDAIGVTEGNKHPLALVGATENAATVQAMLDNVVSRGLAPDSAKTVHRRQRESVVEGIRRTFGSAAAIQRCQIHKARNITERLSKEHRAPHVACSARPGSSMRTRLKN
ncbi:hypothetical protein ACVWXL_009153 [Bradyrhizobium sp. GM22.5]